jgi:RNA polymerase sigma factor (sigma-70 family)
MGTTSQEEQGSWAILIELNAQSGWGLGRDTLWAYSQFLNSIRTQTSDDAQLRRVACNYHADHALVEALLQREHAEHAAMWERWAALARPIVRRAGMIWEFDSAVSFEDLVQVARMELARALPRYRYASRFSTWAHQVVVQSVLRYLRGLRAQKRFQPRNEIEDAMMLFAPPQCQPEIHSQSSALFDLVYSLLHAQPDPRLARIFCLWAIADCRISEIGMHVGLSESRVRVLLNQSRRILASSPAVREWACSGK